MEMVATRVCGTRGKNTKVGTKLHEEAPESFKSHQSSLGCARVGINSEGSAGRHWNEHI